MKIFQGPFFHRQVSFDIHVCGCRAFVSEPKSDHGYIHSGLEQVHGD